MPFNSKQIILINKKINKKNKIKSKKIVNKSQKFEDNQEYQI